MGAAVSTVTLTYADLRQGWRGEQGAAWAVRNQITAEATDASYRIRFGCDKTRALAGLMEGRVPLNASLLEVGCSAGGHLNTLAAAGWGNGFGCDLNFGALQRADVRSDLRVVQADAIVLPFRDNAVDLATTSGLLMHVPPWLHRMACRELTRVAQRWLLICEAWAPVRTALQYPSLMPISWIGPWERVLVPLLPGWRVLSWTVLRSPLQERIYPKIMMLLMERAPGPWEFTWRMV